MRHERDSKIPLTEDYVKWSHKTIINYIMETFDIDKIKFVSNLLALQNCWNNKQFFNFFLKYRFLHWEIMMSGVSLIEQNVNIHINFLIVFF